MILATLFESDTEYPLAICLLDLRIYLPLWYIRLQCSIPVLISHLLFHVRKLGQALQSERVYHGNEPKYKSDQNMESMIDKSAREFIVLETGGFCNWSPCNMMVKHNYLDLRGRLPSEPAVPNLVSTLARVPDQV
jgi:hypothetical protein